MEEEITHAFPCTYNDGMELRDYFAAKAMQHFMKTYSSDEIDFLDVPYLAYAFADKMVKHAKATKAKK